MPYLKGDAPSQLDVYVPQITRAYITSRLESVQAVVLQGVAEDPLDNEEQLQVGRGVGRNGICALGGAVGLRVVQGGAGWCRVLLNIDEQLEMPCEAVWVCPHACCRGSE